MFIGGGMCNEIPGLYDKIIMTITAVGAADRSFVVFGIVTGTMHS